MNKKKLDHYGIDIEDRITNLLVNELSKSIDKQIFENLFRKKNSRKSKINNIFRLFE